MHQAPVMSNQPNPPTYQSPTGTLYAIADIHVAFAVNKAAWAELAPHPRDGLILCGDVGETVEHLQLAFSTATKCFGAVWWCPGNHELYTFTTGSSAGVRGESKYQQCVEMARSYGVLTPEDDFVLWEGQGGPAVIAPIFTLYDYSFRPDNVTLESMPIISLTCSIKQHSKACLLQKCMTALEMSSMILIYPID
jgi:hypothetical protein